MPMLSTIISIIALMTSIAIPLAQYLMRQREQRLNFKDAWSADFIESQLHHAHRKVRLLYSTPDSPPLTLEHIKILRPKLARLALIEINFGEDEGFPALPWRKTMSLHRKMTKFGRYSPSGVLFSEFSRYDLFVQMPSADRSNERARLSMRITVERASPSRSRHSFRIRTDEIALRQNSKDTPA